jgi:hypothetical protein
LAKILFSVDKYKQKVREAVASSMLFRLSLISFCSLFSGRWHHFAKPPATGRRERGAVQGA